MIRTYPGAHPLRSTSRMTFGTPGRLSTWLRGRMQDAAPVVRLSPLRARLGPPTLVGAGSGLRRRRGIRVSLTMAQVLQSRLQRLASRKASRRLTAELGDP